MDFRLTPEDEAFRQEVHDFIEKECPKQLRERSGGIGGFMSNAAVLHRVAQEDRRQGLGRARLAEGVRRRRHDHHGAVHLQHGDRPHARPLADLHRRPRRRGARPDDPRLRHRRAEAGVHPRHPRRRSHVVPGLLRARLRLRPRLAPDPRGPRRRRLRHQRPEDLDHARPHVEVHALPGPHRPRRPQAQGHLVLRRSRWTRPASPCGRSINMAGTHEFNEVFFDNVRIPAKNLPRRGETAAGTWP